MTITKSGVIVFNFNKTKILLVQNKTSKKWGFPKGEIQQNETFIDACFRELKEETNITKQNIFVFHFLKIENVFLLCAKLKNLPNIQINDKNEIQNIKFFDKKTICSLPTNRSAKMYIKHYLM